MTGYVICSNGHKDCSWGGRWKLTRDGPIPEKCPECGGETLGVTA